MWLFAIVSFISHPIQFIRDRRYLGDGWKPER